MYGKEYMCEKHLKIISCLYIFSIFSRKLLQNIYSTLNFFLYKFIYLTLKVKVFRGKSFKDIK